MDYPAMEPELDDDPDIAACKPLLAFLNSAQAVVPEPILSVPVVQRRCRLLSPSFSPRRSPRLARHPKASCPAVRKAQDASVICLIESKLESVSAFDVCSLIDARFDGFDYLLAAGTRGGIFMAWQSAHVVIDSLSPGVFSLSGRVCPQGGSPWWFSAVYGPTDHVLKPFFLDELRELRASFLDMWAVAGDFNLLLDPKDKNNPNVHRSWIRCFRLLVNELTLKDALLVGRSFTWSNERENPTLEKIDRWFGSVDWELRFPDNILFVASSSVSDHSPLLMSLAPAASIKRHFQFQSFWPFLPGFAEEVARLWTSAAPCLSTPLLDLDRRLRVTAGGLRKWSEQNVGNIKLQLCLAHELILRFDSAQDLRPLSSEEAIFCKLLKWRCLALASLERTIARQRSRLLWLKEGDANTRFFHAHAAMRRKRNFIHRLSIGGVISSDHQAMEEVAHNFFAAALGPGAPRFRSLDLARLYPLLPDLSSLDSPWSEAEVWDAIHSMPPDKAPGPDGFSIRFFQCCWPIIKVEVLAALDALFHL
ncbi:hypothetical protein BRADI_4g26741v3 [Brachypodium distachyon]|uniref:Endonuclease/exonuclease/phosphatase domain-containing protein n=1 Tax=Brachypodium distachyon TaxID=15368 RepID=A0A0Q3EQ41_BRADI|nr:hypothetical protein BRADI_4g26741v3 [Brachypodium distachyon]